jgi:hypothetical protein
LARGDCSRGAGLGGGEGGTNLAERGFVGYISGEALTASELRL